MWFIEKIKLLNWLLVPKELTLLRTEELPANNHYKKGGQGKEGQ